MHELIPTLQNEAGEITLSGRELHEFLEVRTAYKDWFPRMVTYGFEEEIDFTAIAQKRATAQGNITTLTDHQIKLDMAKEIAMIQRTDKGKEARQYFLKLEKLWNSPEMVIKRAMEIQQKKIMLLESKIAEDEKFTSYGKAVGDSDGSITVGALAKILYDKHGVSIGRNKLMAWLRDNGYLIKQVGREKNFPKQHFIERGWFKLSTKLIKRTEGDVQSGTPLVTGKGQVELAKLLMEEFSAARREVQLLNS
ncbi:phage antirepressor KilAC domain-containing protein [Planococcus faecalis]|uniref:Oxidoreductase n=1 Tax=Planococcus faecalis TaxID=1598147 RepID=A0ABN4XMN0_9BACL|nr:phage antirepressor KilAC domain-containing protein [Planococcus faecalis]AQU79763.1 hypothetical protein AJGP001_11010 [Planococcus faecalis]OHX52042.1 hypothetical protein BB777_14005 [Planococcus faecalis]